MLGTTLNVVFGVIGLVAFVFTIWQWRQSETARGLLERSLQAIVLDAEDFRAMSKTQAATLFARQIQHRCNALLRLPSVPGRYFVRFYPSEESSAWLTHLGSSVPERVERDASRYRLVMKGRATRDGTDKLLYGPYEVLPLTGSYRVSFHLAINPPEGLPHQTPVVRLDVLAQDKPLAVRHLRASDVERGFDWYWLSFEYRELGCKLEYRVALLKKDVEVTSYDVTVQRLAD